MKLLDNLSNKYRTFIIIFGFLNVVTLLSCFGLSFFIHHEYDILVEQNKEWSNLKENIIRLSDKVTKLNSPGNNIFSSKNISLEKQSLLDAHTNYVQQLQTTNQTLNTVTNKKIVAIIKKQTEAIKNLTSEMIKLTEDILIQYQKNNINTASSLMSKMDNKYSLILGEFNKINELIRQTQSTEISEHSKYVDYINNYQILFGTIVLLVILGFSYHSLNIFKFVVNSNETINIQKESLISSAKLSTIGLMTAGIAHEINNPLSVIQSKTATIRKKIEKESLDKKDLNNDLTKIDEMIIRITKIIKGLRSFSRSGDADPMEYHSLNTIITESADLCSIRLKNKSIELIIDSVPNIDIYCRSTQVSQVLINLINNAHDAIADLDGDKWIKINISTNEDHLKISVIDSGNGISQDLATKIMEPFFTTKTVGKGTGLGLSICKNIVEDHGGRIDINHNNQNTEFYFTIPIKNLHSRYE